MTPRPPGKAAQAMQRLRDENAALRDLLAAVQETAAAGHATHGSGDRHWHPGWLAATRISIWLGDAGDQDAAGLASTAAMFRENAAEITALGEPAPADASACPSVSPDGDACTVEEPGHAWHYGPDEGGGVRRMWDDAAAAGQPVAGAGDEPLCQWHGGSGQSGPPCQACADEQAGREQEAPGEADGFAAAELASAEAIDAQEHAGLRAAR